MQQGKVLEMRPQCPGVGLPKVTRRIIAASTRAVIPKSWGSSTRAIEAGAALVVVASDRAGLSRFLNLHFQDLAVEQRLQ